MFAALKRSLGAEVWIRSILGVAVLAGVAAIAFGLDRGILTQLSLANTSTWSNQQQSAPPKRKRSRRLLMMV